MDMEKERKMMMKKQMKETDDDDDDNDKKAMDMTNMTVSPDIQMQQLH